MKLIKKKLLLTTAASIKGSSINTNSSLDKKENKLVEQFLTWNNQLCIAIFYTADKFCEFYDNVIYQCIFLCSFDGHCYHKVAGLENVFQAENKLKK